MFNRLTNHLTLTLAIALISSGCTLTTPGGVTSIGGKTSGGGGNTVNETVNAASLEPIEGLQFSPITAATSKFIAANGIIAAGTGNAIAQGAAKSEMAPNAAVARTAIAADAPMASSSGAAMVSGVGVAKPAVMPAPNPSTAGGAYSGNVWSFYNYGGYFSGYGADQLALDSLQQAETAGNKGSFAQIVSQTAAPVVKKWASDARLISSSALVDNNGALIPTDTSLNGGGGFAMGRPVMVDAVPPMGYGDPNGWSLTYASDRKLEVISFTVTASKTTVVRMRWEKTNLDPARVLVDSSKAIAKAIAAIQDKNFMSEEEKTKKDYFLGFPFEQPTTNNGDPNSRTDVLYKVPENTRWNVSLQEVMGKMVWQLNYYADGVYPMPMVGVAVAPPMMAKADASVTTTTTTTGTTSGTAGAEGSMPIAPSPIPAVDPIPCGPDNNWQDGGINNSGQAMVDAETGAVIRFSRPTHYYYNYNNYGGVGCPAPIPVDVPVPVASAVPPQTSIK